MCERTGEEEGEGKCFIMAKPLIGSGSCRPVRTHFNARYHTCKAEMRIALSLRGRFGTADVEAQESGGKEPAPSEGSSIQCLALRSANAFVCPSPRVSPSTQQREEDGGGYGLFTAQQRMHTAADCVSHCLMCVQHMLTSEQHRWKLTSERCFERRVGKGTEKKKIEGKEEQNVRVHMGELHG